MEGRKQRTIKCTKCGKEETESVFGIGFPGWNRLTDIFNEEKKNPQLCSDCIKKLCDWLEPDSKDEDKKEEEIK